MVSKAIAIGWSCLWLTWVSLSHAAEPDAADVFAQRIMPIFNSSNPSSCVQCHLSSVDLKDYILPSSRATFLSLRDQGLVDTNRPEDSKILQLIAMGDSDPDKLAERIHAKNRQAEYEAFASWIKACCENETLLAEPAQSRLKKPAVADQMIRHTRKDRVIDSFARNIWSQRMRCFPCHTPNELDADNPMHKVPRKRYEDFVAQYGARMNVFRETPEATLRALVASSRKTKDENLPLINVQSPMDSLLLLKPTAKLPAKGKDGKIGLPSSIAPVSHMGGIKMHKDDQSYKAFALWLDDYAKIVLGEYSSFDQLPSDNWLPTQNIVRVKGLPSDWPKLATVQIFVHLPSGQGWDEQPIAFTQNRLTPRRIVGGALFQLTPVGDVSVQSGAPDLAAGPVQLRIYLDRDGIIAERPTAMLNTRPADAIAEIQAEFRQGFKNADVVEADQLQVP